MSDFFRPKLQAVEALAPYRLRTSWSTGEVLEVDIQSVLSSVPALANLLDPKIFAKAHVAEWGHSVEWFDAELGADNVYAWAKEQAGEVSHQMFDTWMHRNGLSLNTAADPARNLAGLSGLGSHSAENQNPAARLANSQGVRVGTCVIRKVGDDVTLQS